MTIAPVTDAHTPRFRAILEAAEQQIRKGEVIGHREFWKTVSERHREADTRRRARRLKGAPKRAQKTSMRDNAEFATVEKDPSTARPGRPGVRRAK